jgi:hypothetical protein
LVLITQFNLLNFPVGRIWKTFGNHKSLGNFIAGESFPAKTFQTLMIQL